MDPKDMEGAVVEHLKDLEPAYNNLAKINLKLAEFS